MKNPKTRAVYQKGVSAWINEGKEKQYFEYWLKKEFGICKKPYDPDCAGCWATQIRELLIWIRNNPT